MEKIRTATVVKHTGSHYLLAHLPEWDLFPAVIKGKIRLEGGGATNPVAVGDRVDYIPGAASDEPVATISRIHPRANCILRRPANLSRQVHVIAANLDMAYLVLTMAMPELKPAFADRFLVTCQAYQVPVTVIINKIDIHDEELEALSRYWQQVYSNAGYRVLRVSARTGEGIDDLRERCREGFSLFSGTSGVGKSSIINALDPSLDLKTGEVSAATKQGRHTTTFYQMHPLSGGGYLIDAPGIRGFGLVDFSPLELANYFPEMLRIADNCRFKPCTHTHEPGCAVKSAVDEGEIPADRYCSYLGMLEEERKYR